MTAELPRYRSRLVHLTAVWAYGVSQPVFVLIDGNPELLLSRGLSRLEIVVFAVLLAVVPPLLAVGYAWLAGRVSAWVGDVVYLVLLAAGLVPLATRLLKPVDAGLLLAAALVGVLAVAGVVAYARWRAVRLFLGYSIVVPVVGLLWFVNGLPTLTDEAEAAQVRIASPAPVVFLLLDELPASSLMRRSGEIDAIRYPSFARLARQSTWYRNATTVHEWTSDAAPSIVTGRVIRSSKLATADNYPENLFTLLGGNTPPADTEAVAAGLRSMASGPRPLRAVCARAMAPDPADRYPDVRALAQDVARYRAGQPVSAYRESLVERAGRFGRTYRTAILLVLAYIIMRAIVAFTTGR